MAIARSGYAANDEVPTLGRTTRRFDGVTAGIAAHQSLVADESRFLRFVQLNVPLRCLGLHPVPKRPSLV
jgi:hypothetical protein